MEAACRVLRYLKDNAGEGIFLHAKKNVQLYNFYDVDWGAYSLFKRSLTGYFMSLVESPMSWKTKKQATVSRSSAEA